MTIALSDMRSRIADDLARSDLNTQIDKAINRAIYYYQKEPFWFKETTSSFSTVINQEEYIGGTGGVPSDIAQIDYLERIVGGSSITLTEITSTELEAKQSGTAIGLPYEFAQYQNRFKLYPIPNQVMTMPIGYTKSYAALVADADTNDWLTYAEDLIENRARWWLNFRVIKDYEAAGYDKIGETDALLSLRQLNFNKTGQGRVIPTSF